MPRYAAVLISASYFLSLDGLRSYEDTTFLIWQVLISASHFLSLDGLRSYEELRDSGLLLFHDRLQVLSVCDMSAPSTIGPLGPVL
jgi:hypothetical protein